MSEVSLPISLPISRSRLAWLVENREIAGHRITVQNCSLSGMIWLGITADAIADEYGLTLAEIHAAPVILL